MQWHQLVKNLLRSLKVEDAISNSFKNFHSEGMDYLCLFRSEDLTVKIYDIVPNYTPANKHHNVIVNPHNHGYDFHTILLAGYVENIIFKYIPKAIQDGSSNISNLLPLHNHFEYVSKIKSVNHGFKYIDKGDLVVEKIEVLQNPGDTYFLDNTKIHSIRPGKTIDRTTLLLLQYKDVDKVETDYFCREESPTTNPKLYQKFTKPEIIDFIKRIDTLCTDLEVDRLSKAKG